MIADFTYRALVVDDEALVRMGTMRALSRCGFSCVPAADGKAALELINTSQFDVVVSDLRMPEVNGHALAVDLASRRNRPVVVILTGIAEPKLAEDLLLRGVDDIQFKPVKYDEFAARVKSLVDARAKAIEVQRGFAVPDDHTVAPTFEENMKRWSNVEPADVQEVVSAVRKRFTSSPVDFDGFKITSSNSLDVRSLASAIESQPSLAFDVLKMANDAFYRSAERIHQLEQAARSRPAATPNHAMASNPIGIFVGGIILGWLLSFLGSSMLFFK